jgi:hypothetical protein
MDASTNVWTQYKGELGSKDIVLVTNWQQRFVFAYNDGRMVLDVMNWFCGWWGPGGRSRSSRLFFTFLKPLLLQCCVHETLLIEHLIEETLTTFQIRDSFTPSVLLGMR